MTGMGRTTNGRRRAAASKWNRGAEGLTGERVMSAEPKTIAAFGLEGPERKAGKRAARRATAMLMAAAMAATALTGPATSAKAAETRISISHGEGDTMRETVLGLNKSIVVDLPSNAHDVLVADPDIADAVVRTARRLYVFGKAIGQTNIFVFGRSGEQIAALDLAVERDISQLSSTIARLVPNSDVSVEMINDNVVLTGTVDTPAAAAKAVQLAEVFAVGGEKASFFSSSTQAQQVSVLQAFQPRRSRVVNLLKVIGEDQVLLKVTVAEVQRAVVKQLGMDTIFRRSQGDGLSFTSFGQQEFFEKVAGPRHGFNSVLRGFDNLSLDANLRALEQTGVMRTLAEPSMTAISGELAQFKVGGQFPILKEAECEQNDDGTTKKAFDFENVDYGVSMAFTPTVLSSGRISLKVRTEVSEPSTQGMQSGLCGNLMGVKKRLADTTVELPSGGAMVIGGLVQDNIRQVSSGVPGLKQIPVLGALFRSKEFVRNETELVIILTPYLVKPVAPSALTRPDKNFQPASDGAGMLLGRINRVYGTKTGKLPKGRYVGSIGFILD